MFPSASPKQDKRMVSVMVYLTTVSLECGEVLVVLEDGSSTIEECIGHHTQGEEVSSRVEGVGEGILWGQVVQGGLTDGLAVGGVFLKGPEGLRENQSQMV